MNDETMMPIQNAEFLKDVVIVQDSYIVTLHAPPDFSQSVLSSSDTIQSWVSNFKNVLDDHSDRLAISDITASRGFQSLPLLPGYSAFLDQDIVNRIRTDKEAVNMVEQDYLVRKGSKSAQRKGSHATDRQATREMQTTPHRNIRKRDLTPENSPAYQWNLPYISEAEGFHNVGRLIDQNFAEGYDHVKFAGQGVRAYVADSGVDATHPDFHGRVRSVFPAGHQLHYDTLNDEDGHGTNVAGIIGSSTFGVAPNVTIVASQNHDETGFPLRAAVGDMYHIYDDVSYAHRDERGVVINFSAGAYFPDGAFERLLERIWDEGGVIVTSAGNEGQGDYNSYPCAYRATICVGSINWYEERAMSSNFGPMVDIVAPGEQIKTLSVHQPVRTTRTGRGYYISEVMVDGTSFAAPHVAGIIAIILSQEFWKRPDFTRRQCADYARKILFANAIRVNLREYGLIYSANTGIINSEKDPDRPFLVPQDLEDWLDQLGRIVRSTTPAPRAQAPPAQAQAQPDYHTRGPERSLQGRETQMDRRGERDVGLID
ncbi:MAG: hypothetical protein M1831_001594 [Alyxoria varia]|nr:MAG: hypothetical protein M1831_001594 [Alyxoria varia]